LKSKDIPSNVIEAFTSVGITGPMLLEGLSDDDLKEMGIAMGVQRRAVLALIKSLVGGMFSGSI
jgi:hypothetical protein